MSQFDQTTEKKAEELGLFRNGKRGVHHILDQHRDTFEDGVKAGRNSAKAPAAGKERG